MYNLVVYEIPRNAYSHPMAMAQCIKLSNNWLVQDMFGNVE